MAKGKKGGGQQESKKAQQKKKQVAIEDKTFGLKNKNKSKKVQQFIKQTERSVLNGGDPKLRKMEEQRARAKAEAKARKKAAKEEQEALFGEALMAVSKKKTLDAKAGKQESAGRDANDDNQKKGTSRAMKMMFQMDAKEMSEALKDDPTYVFTIEDEIEEQRQKKVAELKASGKGTPVTPETFVAWIEKKRKRKQEENKKLVEAEFRKKKGGKGLAVLSGRALYEYKADLFKDRDDDDEGTPSELAATSRQSSIVDGVSEVAQRVDSELFLDGDDVDLDDLEDDLTND